MGMRKSSVLLLAALVLFNACANTVLAKHTVVRLDGANRFGRRLQQLPKPASGQIFLDGYLQSATLDPACKNDPQCGGTLTVDGVIVTVPQNSMVMFPANALTWQECFQSTWGGSGVTVATPKTNLATSDQPAPTGSAVPQGATYHVTVTANQVIDAAGNTQIIAGMIDMFQDPVMAVTGWIDAIDYATGELTINGKTGAAKVRINDPFGRYGKNQSGVPGFDPRFIVDPDNPTIASITGFPMCVPRSDPNVNDDPLCPKANRPVDIAGNPATIINMNSPGSNPDPMKMVPLMVGDYITYSGVYTPTSTGGFVAAYSIVNNVAIYTKPGVDPAYITVTDAVIGTGGLIILGAQEPALRSRWEGFATDWTRPISLWGMDFDPVSGNATKRSYGQVMPDPGPPVGAAKGHWRFSPPCVTPGPLAVGSPFLGNAKGCTPPPAGVYLPPTREVMAEITGCKPQAGAANGIASGGCTYRNPTIEYLWAENLPGTPIIENNFNSIPFLTQGGYTSAGSTLVSTLVPWPSNNLPQDSCLPPAIDVGGPYTASAGGSVTLAATIKGPGAPFTISWAPDSKGGTCSPANAATTTCGLNTATAGSTISYVIHVTDVCGKTFTATATVTISATAVPTIQAIQPISCKSGQVGVPLTAQLSGTTPAQFNWQCPSGTSLVSQNPTSGTMTTKSTITFNAPILPLGTLTPTPIQITVTAGPSNAQATATALVNVMPPADIPQISLISFRCDQHRMAITVTTNVNNPNLKITLQPYTDNTGKLFNPAPLGNTFTYGLVGAIPTYTINIAPVPLPSLTSGTPLTVMSSLGGVTFQRISTNQVKPAGGSKTICTI